MERTRGAEDAKRVCLNSGKKRKRTRKPSWTGKRGEGIRKAKTNYEQGIKSVAIKKILKTLVRCQRLSRDTVER